MGLKFREDKDLSVLALASHGDLERLARVLTHDESDGEKRRAQELLDDPAFKKAQESGDLTGAWQSIAAEMQAYGGDTIVNAVRSLVKGHTGVVYREILADICSHLKLKIQPTDNIKGLEDQLLIELIRSQKDKFTAEDLTRILGEAAKGVGLKESLAQDIDFDALALRIATDARMSYLASLVVPAIASAALPFLARLSVPALLAVVAPRVGGALVPGLNVVAVASTLTLLTSPAYRVTLPAVLEVIRIRRVVLMATIDAESAA